MVSSWTFSSFLQASMITLVLAVPGITAALCVSDITDVTLVDQEAEVCGENGFLAGYKEVEYEVVGYEVKGAFGYNEVGGGDVG